MNAWAFFLLLVAVGCSSAGKNAENNSYTNVIKLSTPDSKNYVASKAYIDSAFFLKRNKQTMVLISGSLSDGCTKLQNAYHTIRDRSLIISLTAWKPADKSCTQALQSFKFIYDQASPDSVKEIKSI